MWRSFQLKIRYTFDMYQTILKIDVHHNWEKLQYFDNCFFCLSNKSIEKFYAYHYLYAHKRYIIPTVDAFLFYYWLI